MRRGLKLVALAVLATVAKVSGQKVSFNFHAGLNANGELTKSNSLAWNGQQIDPDELQRKMASHLLDHFGFGLTTPNSQNHVLNLIQGGRQEEALRILRENKRELLSEQHFMKGEFDPSPFEKSILRALGESHLPAQLITHFILSLEGYGYSFENLGLSREGSMETPLSLAVAVRKIALFEGLLFSRFRDLDLPAGGFPGEHPHTLFTLLFLQPDPAFSVAVAKQFPQYFEAGNRYPGIDSLPWMEVALLHGDMDAIQQVVSASKLNLAKYFSEVSEGDRLLKRFLEKDDLPTYRQYFKSAMKLKRAADKAAGVTQDPRLLKVEVTAMELVKVSGILGADAAITKELRSSLLKGATALIKAPDSAVNSFYDLPALGVMFGKTGDQYMGLVKELGMLDPLVPTALHEAFSDNDIAAAFSIINSPGFVYPRFNTMPISVQMADQNMAHRGVSVSLLITAEAADFQFLDDMRQGGFDLAADLARYPAGVMQLILNGNLAAVEFLRERGITSLVADGMEVPFLEFAIRSEKLDIVEALLAGGEDPNFETAVGQTALSALYMEFTGTETQWAIFDRLIKAGAKPVLSPGALFGKMSKISPQQNQLLSRLQALNNPRTVMTKIAEWVRENLYFVVAGTAVLALKIIGARYSQPILNLTARIYWRQGLAKRSIAGRIVLPIVQAMCLFPAVNKYVQARSPEILGQMADAIKRAKDRREAQQAAADPVPQPAAVPVIDPAVAQAAQKQALVVRVQAFQADAGVDLTAVINPDELVPGGDGFAEALVAKNGLMDSFEAKLLQIQTVQARLQTVVRFLPIGEQAGLRQIRSLMESLTSDDLEAQLDTANTYIDSLAQRGEQLEMARVFEADVTQLWNKIDALPAHDYSPDYLEPHVKEAQDLQRVFPSKRELENRLGLETLRASIGTAGFAAHFAQVNKLLEDENVKVNRCCEHQHQPLLDRVKALVRDATTFHTNFHAKPGLPSNVLRFREECLGLPKQNGQLASVTEAQYRTAVARFVGLHTRYDRPENPAHRAAFLGVATAAAEQVREDQVAHAAHHAQFPAIAALAAAQAAERIAEAAAEADEPESAAAAGVGGDAHVAVVIGPDGIPLTAAQLAEEQARAAKQEQDQINARLAGNGTSGSAASEPPSPPMPIRTPAGKTSPPSSDTDPATFGLWKLNTAFLSTNPDLVLNRGPETSFEAIMEHKYLLACLMRWISDEMDNPTFDVGHYKRQIRCLRNLVVHMPTVFDGLTIEQFRALVRIEAPSSAGEAFDCRVPLTREDDTESLLARFLVNKLNIRLPKIHSGRVPTFDEYNQLKNGSKPNERGYLTHFKPVLDEVSKREIFKGIEWRINCLQTLEVKVIEAGIAENNLLIHQRSEARLQLCAEIGELLSAARDALPPMPTIGGSTNLAEHSWITKLRHLRNCYAHDESALGLIPGADTTAFWASTGRGRDGGISVDLFSKELVATQHDCLEELRAHLDLPAVDVASPAPYGVLTPGGTLAPGGK